MDTQPWSRLPEESAIAYRAFCVYYRLPIYDRSIDTAWRKGASKEQSARNQYAPGHWTAWSAKYHWVARALAHDEHLAELDRQLLVNRRREQRELEWQIAQQGLGIILQALPHAEQFIKRTRTFIPGNAAAGVPDREIITVAFDLSGLSSAAERIDKLGRLANDQHTDHIQYSGAALDAIIAAELARAADRGETPALGEAAAAEPDGGE